MEIANNKIDELILKSDRISFVVDGKIIEFARSNDRPLDMEGSDL